MVKIRVNTLCESFSENKLKEVLKQFNLDALDNRPELESCLKNYVKNILKSKGQKNVDVKAVNDFELEIPDKLAGSRHASVMDDVEAIDKGEKLQNFDIEKSEIMLALHELFRNQVEFFDKNTTKFTSFESTFQQNFLTMKTYVNEKCNEMQNKM